MFDKALDFAYAALLVFLGVMFLGSIVVVFIYGPRSLSVDRQCLQSGYPHSKIDYHLDGYCMNLEGTVTVKVEKVK